MCPAQWPCSVPLQAERRSRRPSSWHDSRSSPREVRPLPRSSTSFSSIRSIQPCLVNLGRVCTLGAVPGSKTPMPVLAVSPTGEHLAVAFRPDHDVVIYSIKELVDGKSNPVQTLRSPGLTVRQAALVRRGEDWGLLLSQEPKARPGDPPRTPSPGDFIIDLKTRGISPQTPGWAIPPDQASPSWQVRQDGRSVAVWRNGDLAGAGSTPTG